MFTILIIFVLVFVLLLLIIGEVDVLEVLAASMVLTLGGIGFSSFLMREYLNIGYSSSPRFIVYILAALLVTAFVLKFRNNASREYLKKRIKFVQLTKLDVFFLVLLSLLILRGFWSPVRGWDAYSLYDSRARAFADGLKQSDLSVFTKYDDTNFLYYFSYPPMTSSIHAVLYGSGFATPMFIYPMFYSAILIFIYSIIKKIKIPIYTGAMILSTVVFNKLLLEQIFSSYTNLPMISFQICFVYFVIKYFKNKSLFNLLFASLSLGFSNWTRNLEPTFVAFLILSIFPILSDKNSKTIKNIFVFIGVFAVSIAPKLIWGNYISHSVKFLGGITPSVSELVFKLLDSFELANLINVIFFMYQSLLPILTYVVLLVVCGLVTLSIRNNSVSKQVSLSLFGTVLMIFLIMVAGTLYFSMTFVWWKDIPGSFLRSNLVLVPLSAIVVAYTIKSIGDK